MKFDTKSQPIKVEECDAREAPGTRILDGFIYKSTIEEFKKGKENVDNAFVHHFTKRSHYCSTTVGSKVSPFFNFNFYSF